MPFSSRTDTTPQLLVAPLAGLAVLALLAGLSGCSAIADAFHKQHDETFTSYSDASKGWVGVPIPAWIPSDATDLHNIATKDETNAVIRVTSSSSLSDRCATVSRVGLPFTSGGSIPRLTTLPDTVQLCGDYEVMPVTGGYLGWFQALQSGETPAPGLDATPTR